MIEEDGEYINFVSEGLIVTYCLLGFMKGTVGMKAL
jgi:hypothetical protein